MIMKKILITGGNGFIAKNLYEQLNKEYDLKSVNRTELDLLDSGIALSELTDSGTLTAGAVDIIFVMPEGHIAGINIPKNSTAQLRVKIDRENDTLKIGNSIYARLEEQE